MSAPILPKSSAPNNWLSTGISGATLYGSSSMRDQLAANSTNITLVGGALDDTYIAYDSSTKVVEAAGGGIDTVQTWGHSYTLSANVENLSLKGSANSTGTGNSGNNLITGNDGSNKIVTGGGNDVLVGSKGADTYIPTKQANSVTWITNFKTSGTVLDKVDLRGFGLNGFSSIQARMTQIGGDVQVDLGNGQKVMFENKTKAELTTANFQVEATVETNPGLSDLVLTFADEFNALNLYSTWKPHDGWGNRTLVGNKELELYVDPQYKNLGLNPFSVKDGVLSITAAKADPAIVPQLGGYKYTSGMLSSHASFAQQYGYFEIRAQMTTEQGMWPAFWMLATDGTWPPELDVVEVVGSNPRGVVQSVHTKAGTNTGKTTYASEDLANGFHTYGMDWTASTITFYFDGQKTYSIATPGDMHKPMYMMVNLAVGGTWPGSPDSTTDWSKTQLKVDYIRAYKHDPNGTPVPNPDPTPTDPPPAPTGLQAVISNATNPADLTDSFAAKVTAANSSTTYTASQMGIAGVASSTTVSVAYDANGGITVTNKGAWNTVKNATVKSDLSGKVTINNFVDAEIALGNGDNTVTVTGTKRGSITTGSGSDKITVQANALGTTDNLMKINAGDGANTITFNGPADSRASITSGTGVDTIVLSGQAAASVAAGSGNDKMAFYGTTNATIDAGDGDDQMTLFDSVKGTINGGAGNDQFAVTKLSNVTVNGGIGNDLVVLSDQAKGTIDGGAGDDRVIINTAGNVTVTGGSGKDAFQFLRGFATITDFNALEDTLDLSGISTDGVEVTTDSNGTQIAFSDGSSILLAGVSLSRSALGLGSDAMEAVISNGMDPSDLSDSFTAVATGAGTSTTYTAAQLGLAGVDPNASVTAAYDANQGLTLTNKGLWNAIKNARVESTESGQLSINNFVDAQVTLGGGDNTISVKSAKRGSITTGAGHDQITATGYSNGSTDNVMKINAGEGNNTVSFSGASNTKTAITTGGGADRITISGQAGGTVNAGAGNDRIVTATSGAVTATGGAGSDIFEFIRGAHATISDFNASQDSIVIRGGSASTVQVKAGNGFTMLDLGNGASVTLAGVTVPSSSINITYA